MSKLLTGETTYNPNKEYYFVDYHLINDIRWVRSPLNTIEEVQEIVANLPYVYDAKSKEVLPMFADLRITPHKHLDTLYKKWNEEKNQWEDDEITNGCVMFDWRYDSNEDIVEGWLPSLTKQKEESKEEWEQRVEERKQVNEQALKERCKEHQRRRELAEEFTNERVAYLVGKSMKHKIEEKKRKQKLKSEEASKSMV